MTDMIRVLDNLYMIKNDKGANVYLISDGCNFDLIDAGMFKETDRLIDKIEELGFSIKNLRTIILSHCHCDHIGGAAELVRHSGAKLAAHGDDIPYMQQEQVIQGAYQNMMIQEQAFMRKFDCVVSQIDTKLSDGEIINVLGGLQVINVPGHTPGSIALYQREMKIMFFSDVIRNKGNKGIVIGVPEKFNYDTEQTLKDFKKLISYPIEIALFGHGEPLLKNTKQILMQAMTPKEFPNCRKVTDK